MNRLALIGLAFVVACGGSSDVGGTAPANGPLKLGIVSGNNQVVTAGSAQLSAPVVGQLVRLPNGSLAFRVLKGAGNRALDLFVPRVFAQTVVTGSPVPNAVVCAVSIDSAHQLVPFTPCTNTDTEGKATFFFTPSTAAGVATAQISGTLNGSPAAFDTAKATVVPGALASMVQDSAPVGFTLFIPVGGGIRPPEYVVKTATPIPVRGFVRCSDRYRNRTSCGVLSWGFYPGSTPDAQIVPKSTSDTALAPSIVPLDRHSMSQDTSYNRTVDSTRFALLNQQQLFIFTGTLRNQILVQVVP